MLVVVASVSGGMKRPSPRKDLAFDRRSRAEADGDRRMMGSGLLVWVFWLRARFWEWEAVGGWGFLLRKGAASLRTCVKSCLGQQMRAQNLFESNLP